MINPQIQAWSDPVFTQHPLSDNVFKEWYLTNCPPVFHLCSDSLLAPYNNHLSHSFGLYLALYTPSLPLQLLVMSLSTLILSSSPDRFANTCD
jgi:hypothetical protein